MAPFPLTVASFGKPVEILIYLVIGFGFGYVLEISGFGNSKKLAAQFYFKELTVLKVMFTAIIVAMTLIFLATSLGLLDYNLIWVNPTYLWPGIVGGLIMGVGFIVGGFCPGTSLAGLATGKLDALFFTLGGLTGIFLFGETVGLFEGFYNSSYLGRLTLQDWLGLPVGVVVLLVILMALFMFWGGEQLEKIFGKKDLKAEPKVRYAGAGALVVLALAVILIGQPTTADKWNRVSAAKELELDARAVQIHPGELLATMHDHRISLVMLDVRDEADFNLFHLRGAQRVEITGLPELAVQYQTRPANTVFVLMSNEEAAATEAWKVLSAESVQNVYLLEGGINGWLDLFAEEDPEIAALDPAAVTTCQGDAGIASRIVRVSTRQEQGEAAECWRYRFPAALGANYSAAAPHPEGHELEYTPKIVLKNKKGGGGGGCG